MTSLRAENLGVMATEGKLTPFGRKLLTIADDEARFKESIAKHLILEKGGLFFCRGLTTFTRPTRQALADFLAEKYQVEFWRDHNNLSSMHSFLEWAGICRNYRLDAARFRSVVEVEESSIKGAEQLSPEANALLQALVRAGGRAAPGSIRAQAEIVSGRRMSPHRLPYYGSELEEQGFVKLPHGRGSRTRPWEIKSKHRAEIIAQIAATLSKTRPIPDEAFKFTFGELLEQIEKGSKDTKGRALEWLAARMCWKLQLRNIEIRHLSEYEIDVRAEAIAPTFQRWIIQCKATASPLGPRTVLREYGIANLEKIAVVGFVTTATISARARTVADQIMEQSNKVVLTFEGSDLKEMAEDEFELYRIIQRRSEHARAVKVPQKEAEVADELAADGENGGDDET